ncbi:MAG: tRNA (guanosine(46)-N7)-methyltransferase TrmB [Pirellulales bacterium]
MPRRALRRIGTGLDLSRSFRAVEELPSPWDNTALFGRNAPLEVEVGSGKGLFLASAGAARPEHDFLGLEIALKYARFAAARATQAGLRNVVMAHGDALRVFREILPDDFVAAVHVYFPDPWWKARHKKRRVFNESFLSDVERVLIAGGRLHFWTDVEEYFLTTLDLIAPRPLLLGPLPVAERPAEHDLDYHTHFERRTRRGGQPVYRSEFERAPR